MDPRMGTREEDWPEVDVDSDTEQGAEITQRAEAAMHAVIERSTQQRQEERCAELAQDTIPRALYDKAKDHQDILTQEERQLLLGRGDVVGKTLAQPDSLTAEETYQVLLWPSPEVVHANISRATGGELSTPFELYAKGKRALDTNQFGTMLNDDEIALLARHFHAMNDTAYSEIAISQAIGAPGKSQAMELLRNSLGLGFAVYHAALVRYVDRVHPRPLVPSSSNSTAPSLLRQGISLSTPQGQSEQIQQPVDIVRAMTALAEQHRLGSVTDEEVAIRNKDYLAALQASCKIASKAVPGGSPSPWPAIAPASRSDYMGDGPWPPMATPRSPMNVFAKENNLSGYAVHPGWSVLADDQKEAYRTKSEDLRREAWAEHERALADGTSPLCAPSGREEQPRAGNPRRFEGGRGRDIGPPGRPSFITGLLLFREELGMEFQEVLRRWDTLPAEERQVYENRATQANASARRGRQQR